MSLCTAWGPDQSVLISFLVGGKKQCPIGTASSVCHLPCPSFCVDLLPLQFVETFCPSVLH